MGLLRKSKKFFREAVFLSHLGLYLHIPFCASKCAYCDFYSFPAPAELLDAYTDALCRELTAWGQVCSSYTVDTVYFGGGTPSLLGGRRLARILERAAAGFSLAPDAEITLEANPADDLRPTLQEAAAAGVNRLSLGVQSGRQAELDFLGRRHTPADVCRTAADAAAVGISNLSVDLMLAIPGQTPGSLENSIKFLTGLSPAHISAYLLKIEEGTPFYRQRDTLPLPDEDAAADLYLLAVRELARRGYRQYEISNFARPGRESRHNLKYWNGEPYLGLGPAAHSYLFGRRFFYPRDVRGYIEGRGGRADIWEKLGLPAPPAALPPLDEGPGGEPAEYAMLRLRLADGLDFSLFAERYGRPPAAGLARRAARYVQAGYMRLGDGRLAFTPEGFLLSNPILADLLDGEI
mgnify:CR=1 FL=1